MFRAKIDIAGADATAYIYDDGGTYIISIPYINFSLEIDRALPHDEKQDEIIAHLFHMMDEDACERIAETITDVTDKK